MKNTLLVVCFILSFGAAHSQNTFLFKLKFLPGHSYQSIIATKSNMEMDIKGDSSMMKNIRDKGIKMPMVISSETNMDLGVKTGDVVSGNFPIEIKYNSINTKKVTNGTETDSPENPMAGQSIFGHYTIDGKLNIDSISGKMLDNDMKTTVEKAINNLLSQQKFPDHPMKIGETFEQDVPFNMPISGINIQLTIKIIYKLSSVENSTASFKLDELLDMNVTSEKGNTTIVMNGKGVGTGYMTYDIVNSFSPSRSTDLNMTYQLTTGRMVVNGKATVTSTAQTQLLALIK